jgi:hydrocephalus-inducing protein
VEKLPEGQAVDFTVTFSTRTTAKTGKRTAVLPLALRGAPTVQLSLAAHVCTPEVELSSETLAFGEVVLGRSRKMFFRVTNKSVVTAKWFLKKTLVRDEGSFIFEPSRGSLLPHSKALVAVEFIPTEVRTYSAETGFRVELNGKHKTVYMQGDCVGAAVKFEPPVVDLGPIFPFSEGEARTVTLRSNASFPMEVTTTIVYTYLYLYIYIFIYLYIYIYIIYIYIALFPLPFSFFS